MIDFDALVLGPCMNSFGEPVTFVPAQGIAVGGITAVFTEANKESQFHDGDEIVTTRTTLGCQLSQFPSNPPTQNDIFVIRGRLWRVTDEPDDDGHGHLLCVIVLANSEQLAIRQSPPVITAA